MKTFLAILLFTSIFFWGTSFKTHERATESKTENDSLELALESELVMLKNQAFCSCFYKSLKAVDGEISPPDGSSYVQISELAPEYLINDDRLNALIEKWVAKGYNSYDYRNKLYMMRCLDFYNSEDLKQYIDSVRIIETKKMEIPKEPLE